MEPVALAAGQSTKSRITPESAQSSPSGYTINIPDNWNPRQWTDDTTNATRGLAYTISPSRAQYITAANVTE